MTRYDCFCLPFLAGVLFFSKGNCQSPADSAYYYQGINNIKAVYFSTIKEKAHLYNGIEYAYYGRGANGSPFFLVDTMQNGSVFYDGILYENVPLRYDMVNDGLLVKYQRDNNTLQLIKNKIEYFSILQHTFIRIDDDQQNKSELSGFCELLYRDKKVLVLAKRTKIYKISSNTEDKSTAFIPSNKYFIYKDEKYSAVNSENDLVKIFNDKAPEIKKFLRSAKVKYKKNSEQAIVATASFYNGLMK